MRTACSLDERLDKAADALGRADAVVVGGGAGLSTAAGIDYAGDAFRRDFAEAIARYGFRDLYSASFYPYPTPEEHWAHWAAHTKFALLDPPALPLYTRLLDLVKSKPYFAITTNVERQFMKAGFDRDAFFEVQGSYGLIQCARACHDTRYDFTELARRMVQETVACRIPAGLVPACPVCGGPMDVNVRKDASFVQDPCWYAQAGRYEDFVDSSRGKRVIYLELGVGFNTPGIIRYPFERLVRFNPKAVLIRMNKNDPAGESVNESKTISFAEDMRVVMDGLLCRRGSGSDD